MKPRDFRSVKNKVVIKPADTPDPAEGDNGGDSALLKPLPDFDLAVLRKYPVETFNSDSPEVDRFVLTLAIAYNDLKAFEWNYQLMSDAAPKTAIIDAQVGQAHGMKIWATRFTISVIHELLLAIKDASDAGITAHPRIKAAQALFKQHAREKWDQLERLATERVDGESKSVKDLLDWFVKIRNNLAFHYGQSKPLLSGYRQLFIEEPKTGYNEVLYASIGTNMSESRFYFADAAAARGYDNRDERTRELMERTGKLRSLVNQGVIYMVHAYLTYRKLEIEREVRNSGD